LTEIALKNKQLSQFSGRSLPLEFDDCGLKSALMTDAKGNSCSFDRRKDLFGFRRCRTERLFTENVLPCRCTRQHLIPMEAMWRTDDDRVNVLTAQDLV
jgi:hypothetical protein